MATLAGPIIGSFAIPILMEYLQASQQYSMIIFGIVFLNCGHHLFPQGFDGRVDHFNSMDKRAFHAEKVRGRVERVLLKTENLIKQFEGLVAVANVSFEVFSLRS